MDEVTEWLQFMQWDESVLSLSDVMLELPLVSPGGHCILEDYPTPRSLVVSISANVMRIMEEGEVIWSVDGDTESHCRHQVSGVDHTGSMISTTTQKKLKKLSMLPRQRENIDFLSATLPILATTSCSDNTSTDFTTDSSELEEDEI